MDDTRLVIQVEEYAVGGRLSKVTDIVALGALNLLKSPIIFSHHFLNRFNLENLS